MSPELAAALKTFPAILAAHVVLCAAALGLGLLVGLPLAFLAARRARWRAPLVGLASLVQTIPGLALLALFYPLLLAIGTLTKPLLGLAPPALGFLPALLALALYAVLPVLRGGVDALTGLDPSVLEAADGIGMSPREKLVLVELPLAAPVLMSGVRTAAVWTIGAATLATPVGQTSLGNYIFSGLQIENWVSVLFGCAAAAGLAIVTDGLFALVQSGLATRHRGRALLGGVGLVAGIVAASVTLASFGTATRGGYVIGAKNFSEQFILADLIADQLAARGVATQTREGLGSVIAFRALAANDLDVYVDYSGTLWNNVLGRTDVPARADMLAEIGPALTQRFGVRLLGALGFENAYGLAMSRAKAQSLGVKSLADLARVAPTLSLGADLEFLHRPEWSAIEKAYGLSFARTTSYDPTFMYRALASGDVDVISGFTSDGRIAAQDLVVLEDPKGALPSYDAVLLVSPKRADDMRLRDALSPLVGRINVDAMRAANWSVDRDEDKKTPGDAARELARVLGLV